MSPMVVNHGVTVGIAHRPVEALARDVESLERALRLGRELLDVGPQVHPLAWNGEAGDGATLGVWVARNAGRTDLRDALRLLNGLLNQGPFLDLELLERVEHGVVIPTTPDDSFGELVRAGLAMVRDDPPAYLISAGDRGSRLEAPLYSEATAGALLPNLRDSDEASVRFTADLESAAHSMSDALDAIGRLAARVTVLPDVRKGLLRGRSAVRPDKLVEVLKGLQAHAEATASERNGPAAFRMACAAEIKDESDTVKQTPSLKRERRFSLPDGRQEYFFWHVDLGGLRLHFFDEGGRAYVGYIGKHLATKKY